VCFGPLFISRDRVRAGRPRSLTSQQEQQAFRWIEGRGPRQYGPDFGLRTWSVVVDLIERKFATRVGVTAVGDLLAKLGLTPQEPLQRAYQRDPDAIEAWQRERFLCHCEASKSPRRCHLRLVRCRPKHPTARLYGLPTMTYAPGLYGLACPSIGRSANLRGSNAMLVCQESMISADHTQTTSPSVMPYRKQRGADGMALTGKNGVPCLAQHEGLCPHRVRSRAARDLAWLPLRGGSISDPNTGPSSQANRRRLLHA
jgi:hypothetical protein